MYITQNGGTVGPWRADRLVEPSIQRAWPDGRVEVVVAEAAGVPLDAPNDLAFGPDERLYFTDPGEYDPVARPYPGYLFAVGPDGTGEVLEELSGTYPNGVVVEGDGSVVWVESYDRDVWRRRPDGTKEHLHRLPERHIPDGLKIAANGDLWITTFTSGGVDILRPDGTPVDFLETGGIQCNCLFHQGDLLLTDFGEGATVGADAPMVGRLSRVRVETDGLPLRRGRLA